MTFCRYASPRHVVSIDTINVTIMNISIGCNWWHIAWILFTWVQNSLLGVIMWWMNVVLEAWLVCLSSTSCLSIANTYPIVSACADLIINFMFMSLGCTGYIDIRTIVSSTVYISRHVHSSVHLHCLLASALLSMGFWALHNSEGLWTRMG